MADKKFDMQVAQQFARASPMVMVAGVNNTLRISSKVAGVHTIEDLHITNGLGKYSGKSNSLGTILGVIVKGQGRIHLGHFFNCKKGDLQKLLGNHAIDEKRVVSLCFESGIPEGIALFLAAEALHVHFEKASSSSSSSSSSAIHVTMFEQQHQVWPFASCVFFTSEWQARIAASSSSTNNSRGDLTDINKMLKSMGSTKKLVRAMHGATFVSRGPSTYIYVVGGDWCKPLTTMTDWSSQAEMAYSVAKKAYSKAVLEAVSGGMAKAEAAAKTEL